MSKFPVIGVLGGGQLGRMLLQEAFNLDLTVRVLDNDSDAPCKNLCSEFVIGNLLDYKTVLDFGRNCSIVTIEIEHVNIEALFQLGKEGVKVFPQPNVLKLIQDKGLQKDFYKKHNLPTSAYFKVTGIRDEQIKNASFPFIMKTRTMGYDGKGVIKINNEQELLAHGFDSPSIIEECIAIKKEISVIVARNANGEIKYYPPVEMEFNSEANLVAFLVSPAAISNELEEQSKGIAIKVIENFNMIGVLAVEMFITESNEILINEVAPRPHNSGHQSIEGNRTSQYAQHLRAILNLPLGCTEITQPSVMLNLLGEKGYSGAVKYQGLTEILSMPEVYVHLYGKSITKPFRKMGHITILAETTQEAHQRAIEVQKIIKVIAE